MEFLKGKRTEQKKEEVNMDRRAFLKGSASVLGGVFISNLHIAESKAWDYTKGMDFLKDHVSKIVDINLGMLRSEHGYSEQQIEEILDICRNDLSEVLGAYIQSYMGEHFELQNTSADPILGALASEEMDSDVRKMIMARRFPNGIPNQELGIWQGVETIVQAINISAERYH